MIRKNAVAGAERLTVRQDEKAGLKALFERVFFDVPYSEAALEALERTRFHPAAGGHPGTPSESTSVGLPTEGFDEFPRTVLLYRGESGIGKTRIFRHFRDQAEDRGLPVYEIHCYDVEGIPFKPFLRVVREILQDFDFGDMLREKYRAGLEALLPEVFTGDQAESGVVAPDWEVNRLWEEDKLRIFHGITQLLFEITALRPVVILVHDLNWGDQGTIQLLRYIGRNIQLRNAKFDGWHRRNDPLPFDLGWEPGDEGFEDPERLDLTPAVSTAALAMGDPQEGSERAEEGLADRPVRLMILANYQGTDSEEDYLERGLRSLGKEPFAYHGEIRRLSLEETGNLLESATPDGVRLSPEAASYLYEATEGFPSYVLEALRCMPSGPELDSGVRGLNSEVSESGVVSAVTIPGGEARPRERHDIIRRRLTDVDGEARRVMCTLALARKPMPPGLLAAVLQCPVEEIENILARLEQDAFVERVVELFPRGRTDRGYYFQIWDYAQIVSETITDAAERAELHQRIGEAIRESIRKENPVGEGEKSFEVFYHLRRGREPRSAVDVGWNAAIRLARAFSIEKAVLLLEDLLRLLTGEEDTGRRLTILEKKAAYELAREEFVAAEESLRQFDEQGSGVADALQTAQNAIHQGEIQRLAGDTNKALKLLAKGFKSIRDVNSVSGAYWHLVTARVRKDRGDVKRAINLCLKGMKICQKLLATSSEETEGREPGAQTSAAARTVDECIRLKSETARLLGQVFSLKPDVAHAVDNFRRALDGFERLGDDAAMAQVLDDLGSVYLEKGTYFRAARYFYRALEIKRRSQDISGLCLSYDQLGMVYLRTGDVLKTISHLTHSIHLKEMIGDQRGLNPTLGVMGELYSRLGLYSKAHWFFDREIQGSGLIKDTKALVDALIRKGWLYYHIGDVKQVDQLAGQTAILASEFKLRFQEANCARLRGVLATSRRNWDEADAQLKKALEIYAKLGNRRQEGKVLLDQAVTKYDREAHDEALKLASKAAVIADQVKAVDLYARTHLIKGNVYRFLKGGNKEKAKEHLTKSLEYSQSVNNVHVLFHINYSLAKLYHYDREFLEAGNYYGKAEAILRRIAEDLPDDLAVRYFEDSRRKVFLEDANRFRREVEGRSERGSGVTLSQTDQREVALTDFRELDSRIILVNAAQNRADFHEVVLREALDLARAERGFVLRVQNRQYSVLAQVGFGNDPERNADFPFAESTAEESIRRGRSFMITGSGDDKGERLSKPRGLPERSLLVVSLKTKERIFGAVYVDRPLSMSAFTDADAQVLESYAQHVGVAFGNRRSLELSIRDPLTGLYTMPYFLERLREAYRVNNLHGNPFALIGFYLPTLESAMTDDARLIGERLAAELGEELPTTAIASWGSPILAVLANDLVSHSTKDLAERIETRLIQLVNGSVAYEILGPEARLPSGVSLYYELRRRLLPEEGDQQTLVEIRNLLSRNITLKDAKQILERHIIENTLRKTGGNITHAAKELGIHRPQLSSLLKKHDLKRERFERDLDLDDEADEPVVQPEEAAE